LDKESIEALDDRVVSELLALVPGIDTVFAHPVITVIKTKLTNP
jgi:hypothetical protein